MWYSKVPFVQGSKMNGQCLAFANGVINNRKSNMYEIYRDDAPIKLKVNALYFMNDEGEFAICDYVGHFIIFNKNEIELVKQKYKEYIEIPPLSKNNRMLLEAYKKGYRVNDGEVISPYSGKPRKLQNDGRGYWRFGIRIKENGVWIRENVLVHRLASYQKFGEKIFESGIEVRHLDNNAKNNLFHNLELGTPHENSMDRPRERRTKESIEAAISLRKFTDKEIEQIRKDHTEYRSYKYVMQKWGITSKGSLWYILNNKYKTVVKEEHPIIKKIKIWNKIIRGWWNLVYTLVLGTSIRKD